MFVLNLTQLCVWIDVQFIRFGANFVGKAISEQDVKRGDLHGLICKWTFPRLIPLLYRNWERTNLIRWDFPFVSLKHFNGLILQQIKEKLPSNHLKKVAHSCQSSIDLAFSQISQFTQFFSTQIWAMHEDKLQMYLYFIVC